MAKGSEYEIEFQRRYIELFKNAVKLGFDPEGFVYRGEEIDGNGVSEQTVKLEKKAEKKSKLFYAILGFLFLLSGRLLLSDDVHLSSVSTPLVELLTFLTDILCITGLKNKTCIVTLSSFTSLVSPPANCSMCRGLRTVKKVNSLSKEEFERLYAYSGRPIIVTDVMSNWTAVNTFGFQFFADLYSNLSHNAPLDCQFFPYKTKFQNLTEVFHSNPEKEKILDGSEPWYVGWGNCDSDASDVLREHYSAPYFLPEGSESSRIDWVFMGSPGYGADMHIDKVGNPSWQAQVKGSKLWTLVPPSECYFECQTHIKVMVKAGEMIILDTNQWHHSTLIVGDEMSVTIGSEYD